MQKVVQYKENTAALVLSFFSPSWFLPLSTDSAKLTEINAQLIFERNSRFGCYVKNCFGTQQHPQQQQQQRLPLKFNGGQQQQDEKRKTLTGSLEKMEILKKEEKLSSKSKLFYLFNKNKRVKYLYRFLLLASQKLYKGYRVYTLYKFEGVYRRKVAE